MRSFVRYILIIGGKYCLSDRGMVICNGYGQSMALSKEKKNALLRRRCIRHRGTERCSPSNMCITREKVHYLEADVLLRTYCVRRGLGIQGARSRQCPCTSKVANLKSLVGILRPLRSSAFIEWVFFWVRYWIKICACRNLCTHYCPSLVVTGVEMERDIEHCA